MQGNQNEILNLYLVSTAIILFLIAASAMFLVLYQRKVMAQKERLQTIEAEAQRQRLAAIVETQEAERIRIARDLHDEVGGMLAAVKMSLRHAAREASSRGAAIDNSEPTEILESVINVVRKISHDLLPPSLASLGLAEALRSIALKSGPSTGVPMDFQIFGTVRRLPIEIELAIYRVVSELITNVHKHALAKSMRLVLTYSDMHVELMFADDGKGFVQGQSAERGLGLQNVETRVESMGGKLTSWSATGIGTQYTIKIAK